eukprot:TRINITY_DN73139_c0_g1_i1.p1 TRINITY_DN73139_c0_g1~~TRINITY_DN73139_c0_g1_i1.p1  ORF type:complete len:284 (+),score=49.97 TRINITY_DN73139_c0_g1_i1:62-853(+)
MATSSDDAFWISQSALMDIASPNKGFEFPACSSSSDSPFGALSFFAVGMLVRIDGDVPHKGQQGHIVEQISNGSERGLKVMLTSGESVVFDPLDVICSSEENGFAGGDVLCGFEDSAEHQEKENVLPPAEVPPNVVANQREANIARKRAEPEWTPLSELIKGEYDICKTPAGTFTDSFGNFSSGQVVRLQTLKARSELNGAFGKLLRFDNGSERWQVQLMSGFETVKVRPDNLELDDCEGSPAGDDDTPVDSVATRLVFSMDC